MGNYISPTVNYLTIAIGENWLKNRATRQFGLDLINQGHECVIIEETNPVQVIWCGCEKCIGT